MSVYSSIVCYQAEQRRKKGWKRAIKKRVIA